MNHVYGLKEVGGTSVLMLSSVPFDRLGLRTNLPRTPLPVLTWQVLSKIPDFALLAGVFLYGIHWITNRREHVRTLAGLAPPPDAAPRISGRLRSLWRRLTRRRQRP